MAVEVDGPSKAKNFSITYSRLSKRIVKDMQQVRHRPDSDSITFNKALYQRYLQRKENESNINCGNNPDKQSKQKKPVHQCYTNEFEDESDDGDR